MIKIILISLAVIIAVFVVIVSLRPADFRVARSIVIRAPRPVVFQHVADLHKFQEWSPWAKMDPETKVSFSGTGAEVGSYFTWESKKTGEGTMRISERTPDSKVVYALEFRKPFAARNTAVFTVEPAGEGVEVTWSMSGRNNFFFKAMSLFMDCDKMMGGPFEQGLSDLKTMTEAKP